MDYESQIAHIESVLASTPEAQLAQQRIMTFLHNQNSLYHWVGIYHLHGQTLKLGAFAGPSTDHREIPVGRGVCGTAVAANADQIVDDVSGLTNYLACNLDTKSEMVALIRSADGAVLGQIDIDGNKVAGFHAAEQKFVRKIADLLGPSLQTFNGG
jgi:L-methionine (R)-S-oxide reductase